MDRLFDPLFALQIHIGTIIAVSSLTDRVGPIGGFLVTVQLMVMDAPPTAILTSMMSCAIPTKNLNLLWQASGFITGTLSLILGMKLIKEGIDRKKKKNEL